MIRAAVPVLPDSGPPSVQPSSQAAERTREIASGTRKTCVSPEASRCMNVRLLICAGGGPWAVESSIADLGWPPPG